MVTCVYGDPECGCTRGEACYYVGEKPLPPPVGWVAGMEYAINFSRQKSFLFGDEIARCLERKLPKKGEKEHG